MINKKIAALLVVPLMAMTACGVSSPQGVTKVHIGDGPFEDPKFKDCVSPGTKNNSPTNDKYIGYPTSERDYDATGQAGSDAKPITVVSKDNAEMAVPVIVRFNQVSDCDTLQSFYKAFGSRYNAYVDDDGKASDGYVLVLRKLMYDPMDAALDDIAKKYTWRQLYNDANAQTELQNTLEQNIGSYVEDSAKGKYFEGFNVLVKKPYPTNSELADAIAAEQSAVASAQSAEAKARATKAQAKAETATAKAEAAKQRAVIAGYGGFNNYKCIYMADQGLNCDQPTYIVNGTKP